MREASPQIRIARGVEQNGKLDAGQVRIQNHRLLLNLVWCERSVSRAELARRTGLSRSTVSAIIADLTDTGLISFRGAGASQGGRRPVMLGFDDDAMAIAGVDMGASHVSVAITDLRAQVLSWQSRRFSVRDNPERALELIEAMVQAGLAKTEHTVSDLAGVGVGVPSPVDPARPEQLSSLVLPRWAGVNLPGRLRETFDCRVVVDNDANLGALAELWWGAGANAREIAFVKIGTGIGCGHIIGGDIYRGASGVAGEIGHVVVDTDGPACICGLSGCLATLVGAVALVARARSAIEDGATSSLDPSALTLTALVDAALADDPLAVRLMKEAGEHLGVAIAGLVNLTNPATVVLGGGLLRAGDIVLEPLRAMLRKRTLWLALEDTSLVVGELGDREVAIGAATLVLKTALDDPTLFPRVDHALDPTG